MKGRLVRETPALVNVNPNTPTPHYNQKKIGSRQTIPATNKVMEVVFNGESIAKVRDLNEAALIASAHCVAHNGWPLEDISKVVYSRDTEKGITTHRYIVVWIGTEREIKYELCY